MTVFGAFEHATRAFEVITPKTFQRERGHVQPFTDAFNAAATSTRSYGNIPDSGVLIIEQRG